jgi:hypothetical protein
MEARSMTLHGICQTIYCIEIRMVLFPKYHSQARIRGGGAAANGAPPYLQTSV